MQIKLLAAQKAWLRIELAENQQFNKVTSFLLRKNVLRLQYLMFAKFHEKSQAHFYLIYL